MCGVGRDLGVALGMALGVGLGVGVGPDWTQYLPPVLEPTLAKRSPPQTTISLPVRTAAWRSRGEGALTMLTSVQLFEPGS